MKKILVLCKTTGQATAFKKTAEEFAAKNGNVEWAFADDISYVDKIEEGGVDCVGISPEMMLVEKTIKSDLDNRGIKYFSIKPSDFGLRRIEKVIEAAEAV